MQVFLTALAGFLALSPGNLGSQESPKNHASWWIQTYGLVDPTGHVRAARAERVFEKVSAAADKKANRLPRLVIVRAKGDPFALALPDGSVVLTEGGLEICYRDVPPERGDARLAFVLGHELAHLAEDHFWHLAAFSSFQAHEKTGRDIITPLLEIQEDDLQAMELQADSYGLQYVAMAGYDPQSLLDREQSFFEEWVSQVSGDMAYGDATHPGPPERADFLIAQLSSVADELDYFHFGVRLHQLGRYEDAILLLERFLDRFPGREVLNNLGLSHYQLALRFLGNCNGRMLVRFKLPTRLDPETRAGRARSGGSSGCLQASIFQRHWKDAVRYLEESIEKDPWYLPARVNLLSAHVVAGNGAQALALAEDTLALPTANDDPDVLSAKAVALYLYGAQSGVETADRGLQILDDLRKRHPELSDVVYNRAAILSERGRTTAATAAWQEFLAIERSGPYSEAARDWLRRESEPVDSPSKRTASSAEAPIPLGRITASTRERLLHKMREEDFVIGDFRGAIYKDEKMKALAIESVVEIVEERVAGLTRTEAVQRYGMPVRSLPTSTGELLFYQNFAIDLVHGIPRSRIFFTPSDR